MSDSFLSQEEVDALLKQRGPKEKSDPETGADLEQTETGDLEQIEGADLEQTETGDLEQTEGADLEQTETGDLEQTEGADLEQTVTGDLEQVEAGDLEQTEKDALGEIANISMGTAATALSDILEQKVTITAPHIEVSTAEKLLAIFNESCVVLDVHYTEGLQGSNLFIIQITDAMLIANLMMGGDGTEVQGEMSELDMSAVAEAMNQMMGSAATSMSDMFGVCVTISPPGIRKVDFANETFASPLEENTVVVVSFDLVVGELIDSRFMQIIPFTTAKKEAEMLLDPGFLAKNGPEREPHETKEEKEEPPEEEEDFLPVAGAEVINEESAQEPRESGNLDLILDVPLRVAVVLGRARKPIGDVLNLTPGTIVELDSLASEPVDILVNDTLIAQGEVVVVNENFGIQVKNIISPRDRLNKLRDE